MLFVAVVVFGAFVIWLYVKDCQERDAAIAREAKMKAAAEAALKTEALSIPKPPSPFYTRQIKV